MKQRACPNCGALIGKDMPACPVCGRHIGKTSDVVYIRKGKPVRGFEWQSKTTIFGWPLIHIAFGRDKQTGRLLIAKGIIAIGQFAIGLVTFAQFGVGLVFGLGQLMLGYIIVGQISIALQFGLGQIASGVTSIGQIAFGKYVLAQVGFGTFLWTPHVKNPQAVQHFMTLWEHMKSFCPFC